MSALCSKNTITGHCANKQCEGTKPKSSSGTPMPVCLSWEWCKCKCHADITKMYKLVELPREEPSQNPDYVAWARSQRHAFAMPEEPFDGPTTVLSIPDDTGAPLGDERPSTGQQDGPAATIPAAHPAPAQPVFMPTPTGRRAKGQLEYDVLQVCGEFTRDVYEWSICTPKLVAERIGHMNGTEPPSTGAINAVWDRWERLGFAKQDKKPSRFVCFEVDGSIATLEKMKVQIKRQKKRGEAEARRTLRPRKR